MFKELRNKFLILNLITISVLMIIAFTTIYVITYGNVRKDIDITLRKASEFNRKPLENPRDLHNGFGNTQQPRNSGNPKPPDNSNSFTLITDANGKITEIVSVFNMDDTFYESAKKSALEKKVNMGKLKLDDSYWAFTVLTFPDGQRFVFLDITSQHNYLRSLIYTFLLVALAMLIVIFFISKFFANKSIKPIKEAFDKQKQFIADASHELKTPLAVINTNVDVLLSNREDSINSQAKWVNYIKSEVERMTKLTNDLLYLTQVEYSDIKMIYTNFNLSESVESVILTMEAVSFENDISLLYDIEPNLIVHGNVEQLQQVIMILLDNALKYTAAKGTVNLTLKRNYNTIVLSVTNTGEGIPSEHLYKIFDRFYRADKSRARKSGGYGLGLAIAKAIIEQHGGKIYAKSILNESTTFTVELSQPSHH